MTNYRKKGVMLAFGLLISGIVGWQTASAQGIGLSQTRAVFSAADRAQTVIVHNSDPGRYLVQARSLANPENKQPGPFMVTPPLFRLKSGEQQIVKILLKDNGMPTDRESLSYLSVSAIPLQHPDERYPQSTRLSLGFTMTIKVFYRPKNLKETVEQAAGGLQFRQKSGGVEVINPSAYFMTIARLTLGHPAKSLLTRPVMVAPGEQIFIKNTGDFSTVSWRVINDYGVLSKAYHGNRL